MNPVTHHRFSLSLIADHAHELGEQGALRVQGACDQTTSFRRTESTQ